MNKSNSSFFYWLIILLLTPYMALAAEDNRPWHLKLQSDIRDFRLEYMYYGSKYGNDDYFPKTRVQNVLQYIEEHYLQTHPYPNYAEEESRFIALASAPSLASARLFLYYGTDLHNADHNETLLTSATEQQDLERKNVPDLSHDEVIADIKNGFPANISNKIPITNAIDLAKLYLALGADDIEAALEISLGIHQWDTADVFYKDRDSDKPILDDDARYHIPDEKHLVRHTYNSTGLHYGDYYERHYKTPVTYWLEEFIEAGYPAAMLDTHPLLYPRFVAGADVETIADMLNNPSAHKIPANINCRYKGAEAEAYNKPDEDICPLTPSINMQDAMGRTPLHIAGETGNKAVYDYLISQSADTSIQDFRNNLPNFR